MHAEDLASQTEKDAAAKREWRVHSDLMSMHVVVLRPRPLSTYRRQQQLFPKSQAEAVGRRLRRGCGHTGAKA